MVSMYAILLSWRSGESKLRSSVDAQTSSQQVKVQQNPSRSAIRRIPWHEIQDMTYSSVPHDVVKALVLYMFFSLAASGSKRWRIAAPDVRSWRRSCSMQEHVIACVNRVQ